MLESVRARASQEAGRSQREATALEHEEEGGVQAMKRREGRVACRRPTGLTVGKETGGEKEDDASTRQARRLEERME